MNRYYFTMDEAGLTFEALAAALGYSESSTSSYSQYANTLAVMMWNWYADNWILFIDAETEPTKDDLTTPLYK